MINVLDTKTNKMLMALDLVELDITFVIKPTLDVIAKNLDVASQPHSAQAIWMATTLATAGSADYAMQCLIVFGAFMAIKKVRRRSAS